MHRSPHEKKSSISKSRSYAGMGKFWGQHDLSDVWPKTRKVKFEVVLEPEATYYPIEKDLAEKIKSVARKQGVPSDTLVNLWLDQKLKETRRRQGKLSAKTYEPSRQCHRRSFGQIKGTGYSCEGLTRHVLEALRAANS